MRFGVEFFVPGFQQVDVLLLNGIFFFPRAGQGQHDYHIIRDLHGWYGLITAVSHHGDEAGDLFLLEFPGYPGFEFPDMIAGGKGIFGIVNLFAAAAAALEQRIIGHDIYKRHALKIAVPILLSDGGGRFAGKKRFGILKYHFSQLVVGKTKLTVAVISADHSGTVMPCAVRTQGEKFRFAFGITLYQIQRRKTMTFGDEKRTFVAPSTQVF